MPINSRASASFLGGSVTGSKAIFQVPQCIPMAFLAFWCKLLIPTLTHKIPEHPDRIDWCIVDWRHLISRGVCSYRDESEVERSKPLADLLECWTNGKGRFKTVVFLVGRAVAYSLATSLLEGHFSSPVSPPNQICCSALHDDMTH
jgi:hypothetical protein